MVKEVHFEINILFRLRNVRVSQNKIFRASAAVSFKLASTDSLAFPMFEQSTQLSKPTSLQDHYSRSIL